MPRRATSLTKGNTSTLEPEPAETEQAAAKGPRRGKRAAAHAAEDTGADNAANGGEELAEAIAQSGPAEPTKARRTRKPRSIELAAEALNGDDEDMEEADAPMAEAEQADHGDMPGGPAEEAAKPRPSPVSTDQTPTAAKA